MRALSAGLVDPRGGGEFGWLGSAVLETTGVRVVGGVQGRLALLADLGGGAEVDRGWGVQADARYLRHVGAGGDVVITMRGRRVARLSMVDDADPLADLRARGLVRDRERSRRRARGRQLLAAAGSVSELVSQRR